MMMEEQEVSAFHGALVKSLVFLTLFSKRTGFRLNHFKGWVEKGKKRVRGRRERLTGGHFNSKVNGERGVCMVTESEKMNVSHEIWMMIMKIYNENLKTFSMSLKEVGLNPTHFEVLHLIFRNQTMDQKTIAQTLNLTQGNITHCIRHLDKLELIAIEKDWKTKHISLTEKGKKLLDDLIPAQHQMMEHTLRGLDCNQKQQLRELLVAFANTCKKSV